MTVRQRADATVPAHAGMRSAFLGAARRLRIPLALFPLSHSLPPLGELPDSTFRICGAAR